MKRLLAAGGVTVLLSLLIAVPVLASELTGGCVIQLRSFDGPQATGNQVDAAQAVGIISEGAVGSQSNPFEVDPAGSIDFLFTTPTVFQNNSWAIYAQGLPVALLSGSDDNPLDLDERGVVSFAEQIKALPFRVVGTFLITGDLWGNNNGSHCHGEGYVKVLGDPVGTIPWDIAVGLMVFSGLALLVAVPYSTTWETDPTGGERLRSGPIDNLSNDA